MLGKSKKSTQSQMLVLQSASEILWSGPFHFLEEATETWEGQMAYGSEDGAESSSLSPGPLCSLSLSSWWRSIYISFSFVCLFYFNHFIEVCLTYKKLSIVNAHNLMS